MLFYHSLNFFKVCETIIFNIIIIGPTGSGKSTLSNGLFDDENILFEIEQGLGTFIPRQQQKRFEISRSLVESMTKVPQCQRLNQEFSIWDIPGFGDSRSIEIDIRTTICANTLINCGKKTLILLLIQIKTIKQEKCKKIVEILNMIKDTNVSILLLVTKTENRDKLQDKLKWRILQKHILQEILDKQNILLFKKPQPTTFDRKLFELDKKDLIQIIEKVQNKDLYKQLNFQIQYSQESKEYLEQTKNYLEQSLQECEKKLLKSQSKLKISQISFSENKKKQVQKYANSLQLQSEEYGRIIQNYKIVGQLIQQNLVFHDEYQNNCLKIEELFGKVFDEIQGQRLYIKGIQSSSRQLMSIHKQYFERNIEVGTILVYSQQSFVMDEDIILPGINLLIKTQQFTVNSKYQINLKGKKGKSQPKAQIENNMLPQSLKGQGQDSGSLYIDARIQYNLDNLTVNLSGGDGGDGQDGADGQNGKDGDDGNYEMVKNRSVKCDFHFEEEPFNFTQLALTFNRTYKCKGKSGEQGGDSGSGGIGGSIGLKGLQNFNFQSQKINIIDTQSVVGKKGQDGLPGKGGKRGKDFVGVEQQIKVFGRTQGLKQLEKKQNNLGTGVAGTVGTEVVGTALGVGIATGVKILAEEAAVLSFEVLKYYIIASFQVLWLESQVWRLLRRGQDYKQLEQVQPHPVDNDDYAHYGEVIDNQLIIEQNDIDGQIQQKNSQFDKEIKNFIQFQIKFDEQIKKDYPIQELHDSLFVEEYNEMCYMTYKKCSQRFFLIKLQSQQIIIIFIQCKYIRFPIQKIRMNQFYDYNLYI
ncbi:hypothetical protein pb186bvf_001729 [Paramecium bursaria]